MRLRRFRDVSLAAAMAQVRDAFGADALILATSRTSGGVEVTAGLDQPEDIAVPTRRPASLPQPGPSTVGDTERGRQARLAWHGVPAPLARRLRAGPLPFALSLVVRFAALDVKGPAGPVVLTGLPGAGKTLTIVRLATRLVMQGVAPTVVCADSVRAGAADQLAAYAGLLGVELFEAATVSDLADALARRSGHGALLIDTPGHDPRCGDPSQVEAAEWVAALASASGARTIAVIPAGIDAAEAAELGASYVGFGARGMIATKLDMTRRLGSVLCAAGAGLPLLEFGIGAQAAGGLIPATPDGLAARLVAVPRALRTGRPKE